MNIDKVSLPYPVLSTGDDILPNILSQGNDAKIVVFVNDAKCPYITVCADLQMANTGIQNYIGEGTACYSLEISCKSTLYRYCKLQKDPHFEITIQKSLLSDNLLIEPFVVAVKSVQSYSVPGLDADYNGHTINLSEGDYLAVYPEISVPLNVDLRNIRDLKSFMEIFPNTNEAKRQVEYELESSKILIILPKSTFDFFHENEIQSKGKESLNASIFLNAIAMALIKYPMYKERTDFVWVQAIKYRLSSDPALLTDFDFITDLLNESDPKIDPIDILRLAEVLMNQPYEKLFTQIKDINSNSHNIIER